MPDTTARLAIPQPKADRSDPFTVAEDIRAMAARLDVVAAMAEQGTLGARGAAGTARRIYFATDEGVLYYDTGAAWLAVGGMPAPSVGVYRNAALSTNADGSPTLIPWDAELWERGVAADAMHSTGVNPARLVAPVAGVYLFSANVTQAIVAAGARSTYLHLNLNGVQIGRDENAQINGQDPPNGAYAANLVAVRLLAAGDYLELYVGATANPGGWALAVGLLHPGGNYETSASLSLLSR
jgi:hypothetical protein